MRMLGAIDLELLEQLFERLTDNPFFVKDTGLRYVAANVAMARLCGAQDPRELQGKTARDMFPEHAAERYESLDQSLLAGGRPLRDQLELIPGNTGAISWLLFSRFPVRDASGAVVGVAATSRSLPSTHRQQSTYLRLAECVRHIRNNFDTPLNVEEISDRLNISTSQLERDFLRVFGSTMQSFLQATRIEKSLQLLNGPASIAQIAQECGYSDHSAFTRRFRAVVGLTPREYRRHILAGAG